MSSTDELPGWARPHRDGWRLTLRIQPGAARTAVAGTVGDALKVRIAAPAREGKANAELLRFLAEELGVAKRAVRIAHGGTGRSKVVEVPAGADLAALRPEGRR